MRNLKLTNYRTYSAQKQNWLCHYCGLPMGGRGSPFPILAKGFLVTAEHLLARQDGGTDDPSNIVAAHAVCNARRHRRPTPMESIHYRCWVKARIAKGRWFGEPDFTLLRAMLKLPM